MLEADGIKNKIMKENAKKEYIMKSENDTEVEA